MIKKHSDHNLSASNSSRGNRGDNWMLIAILRGVVYSSEKMCTNHLVMAKSRSATILIILLALSVSAKALERPGRKLLSTSDPCTSLFSGRGYTLLMVADPGTFSGTPEALHYEQTLKKPVHVPSGAILCPRITIGELFGLPTIVVTSGIGPTSAALCVLDLMKCVGPKIKELIYAGTSGWSSAKGGILNADNCKRANPTHKIARLGDVCVTPMSINWSCKLADWVGQAKGYPDMCFLPQENSGPNAPYLYGPCVFDTHTKGSIALATEILTAANSKNGLQSAPLRNTILEDLEKLYWAYMSKSTHKHYDLAHDDPPTVWGYKQCVEVDSQFFYSGVPWDMTARNYSALTINLALNTTLTAHDVIAVSAMEAVGVAQAMESYNALNSTEAVIPYTFVRGNSDWLHQPVMQLKDGTWTHTTPVPANFAEGYKYAIATVSNVVFSMLSKRCKTLFGATSSLCAYKVAYS